MDDAGAVETGNSRGFAGSPYDWANHAAEGLPPGRDECRFEFTH